MTDQPVVILKTLSDVHHAKEDNLFPGARLIAATQRFGFREWTAREIYVEESAATPQVLGLAHGRQKSHLNAVLEILPEWQIQARFMSAHQAMLLYVNMRNAGRTP